MTLNTDRQTSKYINSIDPPEEQSVWSKRTPVDIRPDVFNAAFDAYSELTASRIVLNESGDPRQRYRYQASFSPFHWILDDILDRIWDFVFQLKARGKWIIERFKHPLIQLHLNINWDRNATSNLKVRFGVRKSHPRRLLNAPRLTSIPTSNRLLDDVISIDRLWNYRDILLCEVSAQERLQVKEIGNKVRSLRRFAGDTPGDYARKLGLDAELLIAVENGFGDLETATRLLDRVKRRR